MNFVGGATLLFSILTIIAQFLTLLLLFSFLAKTTFTKNVLRFFRKYALLLAFVVSLVSTLGSLFYSEIALFEPCKLCWYQRILMYPQVLLLGIAYARRDNYIALYSIALSAVGFVIAVYHYLLQIGIVGEILPCTSIGYSVSCAEKFVMTFGYITIPMMSLSAFLLIFSLMLLTNIDLPHRD